MLRGSYPVLPFLLYPAGEPASFGDFVQPCGPSSRNVGPKPLALVLSHSLPSWACDLKKLQVRPVC